MKRKLSAFLITALLVGLVIIFNNILTRSSSPLSTTPVSDDPSNVQIEASTTPLPKNSIFVPYWGLQNGVNEEFNRYYYFGIAGNKDGIDTKDPGYKSLNTFVRSVEGEKYLVVRMVDSSVNSEVLRDGQAQRSIIEDSISIAKEYGFDGIVLDFEIVALSFDSVIKEINEFVGLYASSVKQSDLPFLITLYGDTFYRLRPYDVKTLSANTDGILIMTYDFHKASGNPGPNFPYQAGLMYDYDLQQMITDFTKLVPKNKISVVFGLFGYDWIIDDTNKGIGTAQPLTLNQIQQKFLTKCPYKNCVIKRDPISRETSISYTDNEEKNHVVWFEDMVSMEEKKKYLKTQGIESIALWAYSYF